MSQIVIIGAGLAGLMAATQLQSAGYSVVVLDKSRGVGGRLATRRIDQGVFDHGAQFFTARTAIFQDYIAQWETAGIVKTWTHGFPEDGIAPAGAGHPRYIGTHGMTTLPKYLAKNLDIRTHQHVDAIEQDAFGWQIRVMDKTTNQAIVFSAEAVIVTAPLPQAQTMLEAGQVPLSAQDQSVLATYGKYDAVFAIMAVTSEPSRIPEPGAARFSTGDIAWLADNTQKGISPQQYGLTIHTSATYAQVNLDRDRTAIAEEILDQAAPYIEGDRLTTQVHRWLYSHPQNIYPADYYPLETRLPLILAGDVFGGARVEGAALSGMAAAQALQEVLGTSS